MKIYIFVARWSYCDGMAVVTAQSFDEAVLRLILEYPERLDTEDIGRSDYKHAFVRKADKTSESCYRWELEAELELADMAANFCSIEFNYA